MLSEVQYHNIIVVLLQCFVFLSSLKMKIKALTCLLTQLLSSSLTKTCCSPIDFYIPLQDFAFVDFDV